MEELPNLPTYTFEPSLAGLLSLTLTILLPLLVALIVRASWSATAKGVTLLGASAVKTFIEAWLSHVSQGEPFAFYNVLYMVLINFGIAVAAYFGLLKTAATRLLPHGNKDREEPAIVD